MNELNEMKYNEMKQKAKGNEIIKNE